MSKSVACEMKISFNPVISVIAHLHIICEMLTISHFAQSLAKEKKLFNSDWSGWFSFKNEICFKVWIRIYLFSW